jgi:lipopolysaccharide transport system permease protein
MSTSVSDSVPPTHPATTTQTNSRPPQHELPDQPLVVVQPTSSWSLFDFKELWAHRELLYFLTLRDLKVRYKQTVLGIAWVVAQPVLLSVIFTIFLGMLVRVPTSGIPYPLMIFTGLLPWTFFSTSVLGAAQSLVGNASLITKVYFPRVLVPAATVAGRLVDFAVSLVILVGLILYFRFVKGYPINLTWHLLAFPPLVLLMVLMTLGVCILASCVNVKYRDVGIALPVLVQLWMFVSPIVYSADLVPARWRLLYSLNPLVGLVEGFRAAVLGLEFPRVAITISVIVTIILLVGASLIFRRTEKTFADIV